MQNFNTPRNILIIYSSFIALSSAAVIWGMLSSPSETGSAVLFGLSIPRLAIVLGLLFVLSLFTGLAIRAFKDQVWANQFLDKWFGRKGFSQRLIWLSGISFGLGWIGCFLPGYRVGSLVNYWMRVQPVMIFILLASLATLMVFFVVRIKHWNPAPLKLGLPLFIMGLLVLGVMFFSGFGVVSPQEDFWYGAGIPILAGQLIAAIGGGILCLHFVSRWHSRYADVLICILLYGITAFAWAQAPLQKSFLMTGPYPPNHVFYPFADAAVFDTASQFALIGQKIFIFNSLFFERPLYLSFLVYLHALFGQDYLRLAAVQAGIFAVLPVLIYLIGRSLNFRSVGFASALVAMLRGLNSIAASNLIDTSSPKMLLTDFPTAIGIALIMLFTCEWLHNTQNKQQYAIWVGGAIGFALMLRTNALLFLVFVPFYALFVFTKNWRQWLISSVLILLGAISITLPWEIRNVSLGGQMYGPIVEKFRAVIQQRYQPQSIPATSVPQNGGMTSIILKGTQTVITIAQSNHATQNESLACDTVICFSVNHFLHNTVTSILILPTSPMLDDLRHLIKERSPYWQADWNGKLSGQMAFLLVLNMFFISSGITLAWHEKRLAGLVPLAVFIVYNLSNGLARTSGGRYLVPADWIIPIYYLLGVFHITTWLANALGISWKVFSEPSESTLTNRGVSSSRILGVFTTLLLFGSLLPLSENFQPVRYQHQDPVAILTDNNSLIEQTGLTPNALKLFLQNSEAKILVGRALYPRYYRANQGEFPNAFYPYHTLGFPRIAFKLIGPAGDYSVVLPGDVPEYFPHTGDMLVLGCNGQNYLDALLVITLDDRKVVYTRKPTSALQCPLQQPVCNNNSVCN